jgi:SAM-dependent MidA family methyltransferase
MSNARAEDAEAPLLEVLRARIRQDGPLPLDEYMRICLADPEHGYWQRGDTIGADGDFITAPEISQAFGELIGLWCAVVWQSMGRPSSLRLVELGPGRGTLMRDALRAARAVPHFLDALDVHLVEVSAPLRELQRQTLASSPSPASSPRWRGPTQLSTRDQPAVVDPRSLGDDVTWHATLGEVPSGPAIVIANEFLDTLPIRQLVFRDGAWRARVVEIGTCGALQFAAKEIAEVDPVELPEEPPRPGAIVELRAGEEELLAALGKRPTPCVALLIDYGPARSTYGDSLQAVRRHTYVDPLSLPGRTDLTAHVRFARLAQKARAAGLAVDGPITQGEFLASLGIVERASKLMAANPARAGEIEAGVQRLISPTGMGELFKVLAVRSHGLPPPPPFV